MGGSHSCPKPRTNKPDSMGWRRTCLVHQLCQSLVLGTSEIVSLWWSGTRWWWDTVPILRRRLGAVDQCGPPSYRTLTSIRDLHCPPQRLGERTGHCPFVDLWKGAACGPLHLQKTEPCWEVSCCEVRNPGNKVCHQGESWLSDRLALFLPRHVCVQPVAAVSHHTLS